jgi:L-ascorbate metabolism protein UlaG (beta-lactamase superfamily)
MEITWYGQSCFRLRDYGRAVVTDPYSPDIGLKLPRSTATIVTVSHAHEDHNYIQAVRGNPYIIAGPGEYEVGGIFVVGITTFHDDREGAERGRNTAYLIEFDDLTVCHLGDLGHIPTQEQIEQFNNVDILLIPVGGRSTLSGARAAEVVNLLEPRIVIPMHYRVPGLSRSIDSATRFLNEMAVEKPETIEMLKITAPQLPEQTRVVLLEVKQ